VVILTFICLFAFVGAIVLVKTLKKHHEKMWCKGVIGASFAIPGVLYLSYIVISLLQKK
jgi:hypothetical protein